jgi:hypothetical protein
MNPIKRISRNIFLHVKVHYINADHFVLFPFQVSKTSRMPPTRM